MGFNSGAVWSSHFWCQCFSWAELLPIVIFTSWLRIPSFLYTLCITSLHLLQVQRWGWPLLKTFLISVWKFSENSKITLLIVSECSSREEEIHTFSFGFREGNAKIKISFKEDGNLLLLGFSGFFFWFSVLQNGKGAMQRELSQWKSWWINNFGMFKCNGRISMWAEYEMLFKELFEAECTDGF